MTKSTPLSVQNAMTEALFGKKNQVSAARAAYQTQRRDILENDRLSQSAKDSDIAKLDDALRSTIRNLREEQTTFIKNLRDKVERELRGNQPADAASIVSRRDASDRVRKLTDKQEVLDVLNDAIANGDTDLANAIGTKARFNGWTEAAETWQAAYPETAGSAEALAYIEELTSSTEFRLAEQITFADPTT